MARSEFIDIDNVLELKAKFISDEQTAKAVLSKTATAGVAELKFVYGDVDYTNDDSVIAVYNVAPDFSEYKLPSWYMEVSESWHAGDNHPIPAWQPEIIQNAYKGLNVVFDDSFPNMLFITEHSCFHYI